MFYFVHIPKTAGNYVRKKFKSIGLVINDENLKFKEKHKFAKSNVYRWTNENNKPFKDNYFLDYTLSNSYLNSKYSFTVVRNPFAILKSYYFHGQPKHNFGWAYCRKFHNFNSFDKFIDFYCNSNPEEWHIPELSKNLFSQLFNLNGKSMVKYALYYEKLNNHILELISLTKMSRTKKNLAKLKFHFNKIEKINTNKFTNELYKDFYNNNMKKQILKKCENIFDTFNYSFETNVNVKLKDIANLTFE